MKLFRIISRLYLYSLYYIQRITRTGASGRAHASYVKTDGKFKANPLKEALYRHHVKQYHEASCSVATVVSIINAIIEHYDLPPETPLSQHELLKTVKTGKWKERMSPDGDNGKRGVPLSLLGEIVRSSLDQYNINYETVETVQALNGRNASKATKKQLRERLDDFETHGNCLIIAHFNQGFFFPDLHIPHISPVGGFDCDSNTVTILDVDPPHEQPYKISFETFYKGISSNYHGVFKPFGFGSGGYIYIKLYSAE